MADPYRPTDDWHEGYAAGYDAGLRVARRDIGSDIGMSAPTPKAKAPRKVSAYSKRYGREFRRVAPKYKTKSGSWKKDGFKRAQKEAHRLTKKAMK